MILKLFQKRLGVFLSAMRVSFLIVLLLVHEICCEIPLSPFKIVHQAPESDSKPACDSGVSFVDVSDIEKAIVVVPDGSSSTDGSKGDVQVPQQVS